MIGKKVIIGVKNSGQVASELFQIDVTFILVNAGQQNVGIEICVSDNFLPVLVILSENGLAKNNSYCRSELASPVPC